jgi:hypothetical protein
LNSPNHSALGHRAVRPPRSAEEHSRAVDCVRMTGKREVIPREGLPTIRPKCLVTRRFLEFSVNLNTAQEGTDNT